MGNKKTHEGAVVLNEDEDGNPTSVGILADQGLIDYCADEDNRNIPVKDKKED